MSYLAKTPEGLLPCPFCGGEGSAYQVLDYPEKIGPRFSVICNGCGASVTTIFQSERAAIEAWNRRAERTCRVGCYPPGYEDNLHYEVCSECGTILTASSPGDRHAARASYCPRCGARVVGVDDR